MSMNMQQVFDMTLQHLRLQGVASSEEYFNGHKKCMYRAPNGNACAIGVHIPKEDYRIDFEGQRVMSLPHDLKMKLFGECFLEGDCFGEGFLESIQRAHDLCMPEEEGGSLATWEQAMFHISTNYWLHYTPPVKMNEATRREAHTAVKHAKARNFTFSF